MNPPKILVKKINGISSFAFEHFELFGKEYKIMLCGTQHNYCYNKTFCEEPCLDKDNCYSLIKLIREYSKNNCIDVFTESRLDERLKNFDYGKLGLNELPGKDVDKIFDRIIEGLFKYNQYMFFFKEGGEIYTAEELEILIQNDKVGEYIESFQLTCTFIEDIFTKDTLIKIFNYLKKKKKKITREEFTIEEKQNLIGYVNYNIEIQLDNYLQKHVTNIRHHKWDIRTLHTESRVYTSPVFFLPEILKIDRIINVNKDFEKFNKYLNKIRELYKDYKVNPQLLYKLIISLLFYLTGYKTPKTEFHYLLGEEFYNNMFKIFEEYYGTEILEINFNKDDNVRIFSELINKQINNSIFSEHKELLYNVLAESITSIILKNERFNDDEIPDWAKEKSFFYNFEVGLFFSDIYTISRLFKKEFDPKKHQKGDICDELSYFKNIVYVGGDLHFLIIYNFINILKQIGAITEQFNSITPIYPENEKIRCVEFDEPIEIC